MKKLSILALSAVLFTFGRAEAATSPGEFVRPLKAKTGEGQVTIDGKNQFKSAYPCKPAAISYNEPTGGGRQMVGVIFDMPSTESSTGQGQAFSFGGNVFWEFSENFYDGSLDQPEVADGQSTYRVEKSGVYCESKDGMGKFTSVLRVSESSVEITNTTSCGAKVSVETHSCSNMK